MPYIGTSPSNGVRRVHTYTATASQTTFSGASSEGVTLSYVDTNYIDVFQNGVLLGSADYTSTSGTSVVLAQGASADDLIVIVVYDVFSVADTVSKTNGGSFDSGVTMSSTLGVTGATTLTGGVSGNTTFSGEIITSTSGTSNLRIGENAGDAIASGGDYNTVVGDEAGTAITTGDQNTFVGYSSGDAETTGSQNTAVGYGALGSDTTGSRATAVGRNALATQNLTNELNSYNTALGWSAGEAITTGFRNTIIGGIAGDALTDADNNVAIGYSALSSDTKGDKSVAIGAGALLTQNFTSVTSSNNVAVGFDAGLDVTTGTSNTLIGHAAAEDITTGGNNVAVGSGAGGVVRTGSDNIAIGRNSAFDRIDSSTAYVIGTSCTSAGTGGIITIGTGGGSDRIYNVFGTNATWTRISDERYKKDITDNTDCGLDFINDLRPRTFKWKALADIDEDLPDYDETKTTPNYTNKMYGLIAQEVKQALDDNNITDFAGHDIVDGSGIHAISQEMFVHPLIKAVQELSAKVTALETENATQATQIADLISRVTALENAE